MAKYPEYDKNKKMNVTKSCITCPSFLQPTESGVFFKKSLGVTQCARFGTPLAKINSGDGEKIAISKALAKDCKFHGEPRPSAANWDNITLSVMTPSSDLIGIGVEKQDRPELVTNCKSCQFFVRDDIVIQQVGFNAGLCAAKGVLLPSIRQTFYARECDVKSLSADDSQRPNYLDNMYFIPIYEDGFLGDADPMVREKSMEKHRVDPADYESDTEVTDADKARGIRAWRKIEDRDGERFVMLPIYEPTFFAAEEQTKIPKIGDAEHPEDYIDHFAGTYKLAALWMELDETPAVWGEAGTGKTELFRHMAWLMGLPFYRFSITGSTELDDLAGKMHFENGATVFKYGRLPRAWNQPCVIVIDEPNTGPNEVWQFLRPLTDNSKQLVLDMNEGERVTRGNDTFLGMAMNPAWDMRNVGANQIGDADANRMMHISMPMPPPKKIEEKIIRQRCAHDGFEISDDQIRMVMRIGNDIRKLCEDGELTMSWAIRPQIKVARALRWFDPLTAYKMASADYLEPQQAKMVMQVVKANVE